jgi:hypothetical protein
MDVGSMWVEVELGEGRRGEESRPGFIDAV